MLDLLGKSLCVYDNYGMYSSQYKSISHVLNLYRNFCIFSDPNDLCNEFMCFLFM
jgi:hypothetical protein